MIEIVDDGRGLDAARIKAKALEAGLISEPDVSAKSQAEINNQDWAILRALSDVLHQRLPYDLLAALRQALFKVHPHFQKLVRSRRAISPTSKSSRRAPAAPWSGRHSGPAIEDFYFTNAIARCSSVMAECSALAQGRAAMTAAE